MQLERDREPDYLEVESARNWFYKAGCLLSNGDDNPIVVSKAKAMVGDVAEFVTDKATIVHGAISLTWDYDLGFYFRRVRANSVMFGDSSTINVE